MQTDALHPQPNGMQARTGGPDDGFWPLQRPDRDRSDQTRRRDGGRSRDNTHRDLPTMPTQRRCQPWSLTGAGKKPELILAIPAALHQDEPHR